MALQSSVARQWERNHRLARDFQGYGLDRKLARPHLRAAGQARPGSIRRPRPRHEIPCKWANDGKPVPQANGRRDRRPRRRSHEGLLAEARGTEKVMLGGTGSLPSDIGRDGRRPAHIRIVDPQEGRLVVRLGLNASTPRDRGLCFAALPRAEARWSACPTRGPRSEAVKASSSLRPRPDEPRCAPFCQGTLTSYKIPKRCEVPTTMSALINVGKDFLREDLRAEEIAPIAAEYPPMVDEFTRRFWHQWSPGHQCWAWGASLDARDFYLALNAPTA